MEGEFRAPAVYGQAPFGPLSSVVRVRNASIAEAFSDIVCGLRRSHVLVTRECARWAGLNPER